MNIFVLDHDPVKAAQLECNAHIVKMVVESAQMLSTAHRMLDGSITERLSNSGKRKSKYWLHPDPVMESVLYKAVHMNHPCTRWTMATLANYQWHYKHFVALCEEYTYRYGRIHSTDQKLRDVLELYPRYIPHGDLTPFPLAMNSNPECIVAGDAVESYRRFYQTKQDRFRMAWTKRSKPDWFISKDVLA
jgi:hypothetical protein